MKSLFLISIGVAIGYSDIPDLVQVDVETILANQPGETAKFVWETSYQKIVDFGSQIVN